MRDASFTYVMLHTPDLLPAADPNMGFLLLEGDLSKTTPNKRVLFHDEGASLPNTPSFSYCTPAGGPHFFSRTSSGGCVWWRGCGPFSASLIPVVGRTLPADTLQIRI